MKRKLFYMITISIITSFNLYAQLAPVDSVIEGNINSNSYLTKSKKYLLRGFVNINPPATLTIQAGTIIYGEKSSKGTLIINRGAKIMAEGTASQPIVFTSQQPAGSRGPGDWGGIIITGNASINVPGGTAVIEGGTGTIYGGGGSPNDNDNSGILKYIRIEFPGIAFLPDNEINGLTLGGVGRGTTIEHIQVSYSGDDTFEWFGGTVNAKYLIAFKGVDDDFDVDFGFRGKLQFGFALRDPNIADISGSNGWESDNDGTGTFNSPRTLPIFSNFTSVGPMADTSASRNPNYRRGAHLRRSSQTSIYNSIVMGWPVGLLIDGVNSANSASGDTLQLRNCIWAGLRSGNGITTTQSAFNVNSWFYTPAYGNRTFVQPDEVMLTDPFNKTNPNPVPKVGSPATNGANFVLPRLVDAFFVPTSYVGAFDPNSSRWDAGWTNYDPQNTNYVTGVEKVDDAIPSDYELSQNYPNPFNPSTTISYRLPVGSNVKLTLYDNLGRVVKNLVNEYQTAGTYKVDFDASGLSSGNYYYQIISDGFISSKKMTLLK
ncbi:MAG: T9SS type A sorting domain-containing protein [Bacteroidetes bacterium]|nr:T9SS type A sorting domain-containing protein [Bacteroidota bacterium]MBU2584648.1 T9SS type A sorting domain-containing protein [Bacteroidota bacterium]